MRFSVNYHVRGKPEFPLDYRGGFVQLIKEAYQKGSKSASVDLYKSNPSCFAIRFDKKPEIREGKILIGNNLKIYVSSPSLVLGTYIYNGLLATKNHSIFDAEICDPFVSYIHEKQIQTNVVTFSTLSPIIVRNSQRRERYVLPGEEDFTNSFLNSLYEQWLLYNHDFSPNELGDIETKILRFKKVVMTHYGGLLLGFSGALQVKAATHVLKFLYQSGIGYRRSHGFGFVEMLLN